MPEPYLFLAGFKVNDGIRLANYTLQSHDIRHVTISRFHVYEYPMALHFRWIGAGNPTLDNVHTLVTQFNNYVSGSRIINSAYGNPYECYFQWPVGSDAEAEYDPDFKTVTVRYRGHGTRIYHR